MRRTEKDEDRRRSYSVNLSSLFDFDIGHPRGLEEWRGLQQGSCIPEVEMRGDERRGLSSECSLFVGFHGNAKE